MTPDDVIFAFFPCTRFQENNFLFCRGLAYNQKKLNQVEKLEQAKEWFAEINSMYALLNEMVIVCLKRGLRLIVENPSTPPHVLSLMWTPATIIDSDRRYDGDHFKKPTQYWFFNFEPRNNFIFESIFHVDQKIINKTHDQVERSMMHPQYANRFIRRYILDDILDDIHTNNTTSSQSEHNDLLEYTKGK